MILEAFFPFFPTACSFALNQTDINLKQHIVIFEQSISWLMQYSRQLTNHVVPCPSWEASSRSASAELPHVLWNTKVHCHACKNQPLVPILSHTIQVHTIPFSSSKIHFIVPTTPTCFLPAFSPKLYMHLCSFPCVVCALPISSSLINTVIFLHSRKLASLIAFVVYSHFCFCFPAWLISIIYFNIYLFIAALFTLFTSVRPLYKLAQVLFQLILFWVQYFDSYPHTVNSYADT